MRASQVTRATKRKQTPVRTVEWKDAIECASPRSITGADKLDAARLTLVSVDTSQLSTLERR